MKRIFTVMLTLGVLFSCCGTALAVDNYNTRASYTLSAYSAELYADSQKGKIYVNYDVEASKFANSIGVKSISLYKSNGDFVYTVYGTVNNGLIRTNKSFHSGDYFFTLTSGNSYYAEVTIFATLDNLSDSRTITTSTVTVP